MSRDLIIVLIILFINTVAAIAYILTATLREKREDAIENGHLPTRQRCILQGYLMLICPVVAGLYFILSYFFYKIFSKQEVDYSDVSFSKERVKTIVAPDVEKELNIVPVEEALAISDKYSLRRLVMDVLKNNKDDSLGAIALSLSSEDSETSHYAASVLMDTLSEFRKKVATYQLDFAENPEENTQSGVDLIVYVLCFLSYNILSSAEEETYALISEDIAGQIFSISRTTLSEVIMLTLVEELLRIDKTDKAQLWANRLGDIYPQTVQHYLAELKVCYSKNNKSGFFDNLRMLRQSEIPVGHDVLQLIKMFDDRNNK